MTEERRAGLVDFKRSMDMMLESDKQTRASIEAMKVDHIALAKIAVATDTRVEGIITAMDRFSTNVEKVTAQAVNASAVSQETKERQNKSDKIQATLSDIVAKHDTRIEHLEIATRSDRIKWGIAAGFLVLIFAMFWADPEAAVQAIDAVKGHSESVP